MTPAQQTTTTTPAATLADSLNALLPMREMMREGVNHRLINARDLWLFLESKQDFSNWIKNRFKEYDFRKGVDHFLLNKIIEQKTNNKETETRGGHNKKDYWLTLSTAKELAMVERSPQGKAARRYFIRCEETLAQLNPQAHDQIRNEWRIERDSVRTPYKAMCIALDRLKQRQGTQARHFDYINESRMINRLVLGLSAEQWKTAHGIDDKAEIRNHLNAEQLAKMEFLERANEMLLEMNISSRESRSEKLAEMMAQRFNQPWPPEF